MKIALIREVKEPIRGTSKSAGIDIFIPILTDSFIKDFNQYNKSPQHMAFIDTNQKRICIHEHGKVFIPSGLRAEVPKGYGLFAFNKSGVGWEQHVSFISNLVDEDYLGEIFIQLFNFLSFKTTLQEGQKLIQLVLLPVSYENIEIVPNDQLHLIKTERGDGAMGSTGT